MPTKALQVVKALYRGFTTAYKVVLPSSSKRSEETLPLREHFEERIQALEKKTQRTRVMCITMCTACIAVAVWHITDPNLHTNILRYISETFYNKEYIDLLIETLRHKI